MEQNLFKSECHLFEVDQRHILFDVLRGDFFEIDDVTHDVLDACDGRVSGKQVDGLRGRHRPEEIQSVLEELERAEILTGEPLQMAPFHPPSRIEIAHLSLCVTRDEGVPTPSIPLSRPHPPAPSPTGRGGEDNSLPPLRSERPTAQAVGRRSGDGGIEGVRSTPLYMSETVALRAVDLLFRESGALRDCEVTFEGGEPLLNLPLLRRIIEYGEEQARRLGKQVAFEVVTDGALLTRRVVDYLMEKGVTVVLEFGPDDDAERGEQIASLLRAGNLPEALHLRVVADGRRLDLAGRVESLARRLPFAASIGIRWANLPAGHPDALCAKDLPAIRSALGELSRHTSRRLLSHEEPFLEEIEGAMAQLLERQVLFYSCGAGTRSLAVSPEGGLFPCFDLTGWESLRMGDVFSGIDADRYREWLRDLHIERRDPCRTCWARYLCGGGCRADAVLATGDAAVANPVSCERIRRTYELAMAIFLEVDERDPGFLSSRYLTDLTPSPKAGTTDELSVLERYA